MSGLASEWRAPIQSLDRSLETTSSLVRSVLPSCVVSGFSFVPFQAADVRCRQHMTHSSTNTAGFDHQSTFTCRFVLGTDVEPKG